MIISAGSLMVSCLTGDLGEEKNPPNIPVCGFGDGVLLVNSSDETVGRLFSFPPILSGDVLRDEDIEGGGGRALSPKGSGIGAEEPANQELNPPFDLSATFMTPSLSPVRVGMKPVSISCFVGVRSDDTEFGREVRKVIKSGTNL
jgi:hypothetical protein